MVKKKDSLEEVVEEEPKGKEWHECSELIAVINDLRQVWSTQHCSGLLKAAPIWSDVRT